LGALSFDPRLVRRAANPSVTPFYGPQIHHARGDILRPPSTRPASAPTLCPFGADVVSSSTSSLLDVRAARGHVLPPANATARISPFRLSRTLQYGTQPSAHPSAIQCPCSGSTRRQAQARARTQRHRRPVALAHRPLLRRLCAAETPSARQPGYCTRSSRVPLGSLLRQRELDVRRIPLRHPLLASLPADLDGDTPSLSCTMPAESFPLFISSHPASLSCHLSIRTLSALLALFHFSPHPRPSPASPSSFRYI
jgi:hypothetical protein